MEDKKMLIFGVNHFKLDEVTAINKIIRHFKPDVVLHELLDGRKYTKKDIDELISQGKLNNDSGVFIGRILETLGEHNILGIGIDKRDKETTDLPLAEKIAAKEEVMLTNIRSAFDQFDKVMVVIDDQHLRFTKDEQIGPISPIVKAFQNKKDVEIIRSDYRKMDADNRVITTISSWFQPPEEGDVTHKEEHEVAQEELNLSTEAAKGKRKKVQDYILKYIGKIVRGKDNLNLYKNFFRSMNDKQFDAWMKDLRDGKVNLTVIIPNQGSEKVDLDNNLKLGKELGFDFFQHIKFGKSDTRPAYTTPNKYMVLKFPIRRAAQLLSKKVSIPDNMRSLDALSGQVTNKSKGAKLSNPEAQVLTGLGLQKSVKELMKYRGGDTMAFNELETTCYNNGMATQAGTDAKIAGDYRAGVVSTKTLKIYFQGMMIKSTL